MLISLAFLMGIRRADWTTTLEVKDYTASIKVVCFSEKYAEWLPRPNVNDVVVLLVCDINVCPVRRPAQTMLIIITARVQSGTAEGQL